MSITVWPALQSIICILGVHFLRPGDRPLASISPRNDRGVVERSFHRDMTILRQHLAERGAPETEPGPALARSLGSCSSLSLSCVESGSRQQMPNATAVVF